MKRGLQLHEDAVTERRRERRKRLRRLADEGLAIRMGARTIIPSTSRGRHHSHRRHRDPAVISVPASGAPMPLVPTVAGTAAQPYYAPPGAFRAVSSHHNHHRSRSRHRHHGTPRSMSSRHGGTSAPVVVLSTGGHHESHGMPVVPTIASSYHESPVTVVRSSRSHGHGSRHGHSRSHGYGNTDPGLARTPSSRHGRHHSRNPSEVYVSP